MATAEAQARSSEGRARSLLRARLEARGEELEAVALTRISAIADPREAADPTYQASLRHALVTALNFGLEAIGRGGGAEPPVPVSLLAQARLAARNGVSLDTVLRRYFAGYSLLCDFAVEEATESGIGGDVLKRLLRTQSAHFDGLLAVVSSEYRREQDCGSATSECRRAEAVRRLLDGELVEPAELAYEVDVSHLGMVATGPGAATAIRDLAAAFGGRLLMVHPDPRAAHAWLGTRRGLDPDRVLGVVSELWPRHAAIGLGEQARGIAGWRLTHRQARAAMSVALRTPAEAVARYADVALLAAALRDDLLATSLRRLYIDPLGRERDGGRTAKETLRAYFGAARNVSSTAAALGVDRRTVSARLRAIEEVVGRPLDGATAEIETALRLDRLEDGTDPPGTN